MSSLEREDSSHWVEADAASMVSCSFCVCLDWSAHRAFKNSFSHSSWLRTWLVGSSNLSEMTAAISFTRVD